MTVSFERLVGRPQVELLTRLAYETATLSGEVWECGVYKGGSAYNLLQDIGDKTLRLFDTFGSGIPVKGENDLHSIGDFSIADEDFKQIVKVFSEHNNVIIHKGIIPDTFVGLEDCVISLAHIDVDQGETYAKCLEFIWPRLVEGGAIIFDDYEAGNCPGATLVINNFCRDNNVKLMKTPNSDYGAYIKK